MFYFWRFRKSQKVKVTSKSKAAIRKFFEEPEDPSVVWDVSCRCSSATLQKRSSDVHEILFDSSWTIWISIIFNDSCSGWVWCRFSWMRVVQRTKSNWKRTTWEIRRSAKLDDLKGINKTVRRNENGPSFGETIGFSRLKLVIFDKFIFTWLFMTNSASFAIVSDVAPSVFTLSASSLTVFFMSLPSFIQKCIRWRVIFNSSSFAATFSNLDHSDGLISSICVLQVFMLKYYFIDLFKVRSDLVSV